MENLTIDLMPLAKQLLGGFPIGIVLLFFIRRYWKKSDEKEKSLQIRLEKIDDQLDSIRLALAELGVKNIREMLDELRRTDYKLEARVDALFRIADEGNLVPKRASDK